MATPQADTGASLSGPATPGGLRLASWVSGALILLGVGGLAWAGYGYWQSLHGPDAAPSGRSELVVEKPPTAVHAVFALHDTPSNLAAVVPAGLGVVWTVQVAPFHRSASVLLGEKALGVVE